MFVPVFFVEAADDDAPAGAGMDEFAVFQIDADVGGCAFLSSVVEEYEVAFAQVALADAVAVLALVFGIVLQLFTVGFLVDGGSESGAVCTFLRVATASIGYSQPFG